MSNTTYDSMDAFENAVDCMVDEYGISGDRAEDIKRFLIEDHHVYDIGELYVKFMKSDVNPTSMAVALKDALKKVNNV